MYFDFVFDIFSFQSTPSVGRATLYVFVYLYIEVLFQSTPSVGRATSKRIRLFSIE